VADSPFRNLAFRDFKRAKRLKLATGQQMAECLAKHGVEVSDLSEQDILIGDPGARLNRLRREHQDAIVRDTPLMFYILREAELNDGKLAGVGAHIVAETFHRAIEGSTPSMLPQPGWRPTLGRTAGVFTMVDLLEYGVGDRHELLSPVG
jgi:hypothetical protein